MKSYIQDILLAWGYADRWITLYHDGTHALVSSILYILGLQGVIVEPWASLAFLGGVIVEVVTSKYTFGKENWWSSLRDCITYTIFFPFVLLNQGNTILGWVLLAGMLVAYFPLLRRRLKGNE